MKKYLFLFLALVMCLPLCACGQKETRIELTADNLESYISFSISSDDRDISSELIQTRPYKEYKYWGTSNVTVTAFLKEGIRLENASFSIRCQNSNTVDGKSPWNDIFISITMPANGEMVTVTGSSINVNKSQAFPYRPIYSSMKYQIVSVSGCVIVSTE